MAGFEVQVNGSKRRPALLARGAAQLGVALRRCSRLTTAPRRRSTASCAPCARATFSRCWPISQCACSGCATTRWRAHRRARRAPSTSKPGSINAVTSLPGKGRLLDRAEPHRRLQAAGLSAAGRSRDRCAALGQLGRRPVPELGHWPPVPAVSPPRPQPARTGQFCDVQARRAGRSAAPKVERAGCAHQAAGKFPGGGVPWLVSW